MSPSDLLQFASDYPIGTVLRDYVDPDSGLRMLILRGPFSFCAYVGAHADHAMAGLDELEFDCHCGITFQEWGQAGTPWEENWFWWGWDYAHFMDAIPWEESLPEDATPEQRRVMALISEQLNAADFLGQRPKQKTLGQVVEDTLDVMMELKEALIQSEKFASLAVLKQNKPA